MSIRHEYAEPANEPGASASTARRASLRPAAGTDVVPLFLGQPVGSVLPLRNAGACGGGTCAACAADSGTRVSQPGDPLEREADAVAVHVMRSTVPAVPSPAEAPARSAQDGRAGGLVPEGGRPLDAATRAFMEPRFGTVFGSVQIHDGAEAARQAHAFAARAYTIGEHVVFGAGQHRPDSHAGRHLIAHELAHVVQARGGVQGLVQRKEDWDFTPADFAALRKNKGDLKIAADSSFVPGKVAENILNTLRFALDAKRSPSATEGINAADFYHGHLAVPNDSKGLSVDAIDARSKYRKERTRQTEKTLGGEFENVTEKNVAAYVKAMQSTLPLLGRTMDEVIKIKGAAIMYHTFETTGIKKDIAPADPRRNILTPLDTNTPRNYTVPKGMSSWNDEFIDYLEFTFLVDQKGEVHVRPGGRDPLSMITGAPVKGSL